MVGARLVDAVTPLAPKPPALNRAALRCLPALPAARLPKDARCCAAELDYIGEPPPPWAADPEGEP